MKWKKEKWNDKWKFSNEKENFHNVSKIGGRGFLLPVDLEYPVFNNIDRQFKKIYIDTPFHSPSLKIPGPTWIHRSVLPQNLRLSIQSILVRATIYTPVWRRGRSTLTWWGWWRTSSQSSTGCWPKCRTRRNCRFGFVKIEKDNFFFKFINILWNIFMIMIIENSICNTKPKRF